MDSEKQNEFYKKLILEFPIIENLKEVIIDNIGESSRVAYSKKYKKWFSYIKNNEKYYYIFGSANTKDQIDTFNYDLIIDFSKNQNYCENCMGIESKNTIFLNKNNLLKKYPEFNINNFEIKELLFFEGKLLKIPAITVGLLKDDFMENLNKIIEEIKKSKNNYYQTNLSNETQISMNLFLNAINAGKTEEQSLKIAKISYNELNNWIKLAEDDNEDYLEFYNKYNKLICNGKSKTANDNLMNIYFEIQDKNKTIPLSDKLSKNTKIKMNVFLYTYNEEKNLKYSLKSATINKKTFDEWIEKGKSKNNEYSKFYIEYEKLVIKPRVKIEGNSTSKNQKLMEEFIDLKHQGKTNKEIYEILDIPHFLIKNWRNQGQLGNKKYIEFYEAYLIDNNPKPKKNITKETPKKEVIEERKCAICGRQLSHDYKHDICKRCKRKQYAVKVIEKILSIVKPGIPFKKDDLKALDLETIQINDYIWTLQEFDLITMKDSKIILKDMDVLNKFAQECNLEINITNNPTINLSKTCKTCGETLEISQFFKSEENDDGYDDNCKKCKKLINSAVFLKELNNYVSWQEEFKEEDLASYFEDKLILKGNLWNLLENDLITQNIENNTYILTTEEKGNAFIEKYFRDIKPIFSKPKPINKPQSKLEKMEIILNAMSRKRSRKEAAIIANIKLYKITHWYNEGRNGFGEENKNFYLKLNSIEKTLKPYTFKEINFQINNFLKVFNETKDLEKSAAQSNINKNDIDDWIILGEENIRPYDHFVKQYNELLNSKNKIVEENDIDDAKRKIFLEYIKNGSSFEKACEQASIDYNTVSEWIEKGKENIEPFGEFYKKFVESLILNKIGDYPDISQKNKFGNKSIMEKMNKILKLLIEGKSSKEACELANFPYDTYKYWINRGIQGVGEIFVDFYEEVLEINNIKNDIDENLDQYLIINNDSVTNELDDSPHEESDEVNDKPDIYERYKDLLKLISDYPGSGNRTGFGWTNKIGNQWIYTKSINKKQLKISDENFYNLFEKVVDNKQIWGVIDKEIAIETLKSVTNPNDEWDLNEFLNKYGIINPEDPVSDSTQKEFIANDILDLLPERYEENFQKPSRTGFAWVNKIGNNWVYSRKINTKQFSFKNEDIYELFNEVIKNNCVWGVRDLSKAKITLKENESKKPTNKIESALQIPLNLKKYVDSLPEKYKDILKPIGDQYEQGFKTKSETGFAWVTKPNSLWTYSHSIDGEVKYQSNENIFSLFEAVEKNNYGWGVRDYDKAMQTLKSEKLPKTIETSTSEQINKNEVIVTYLSRNDYSINILIKGLINHDDLFSVLYKLKSFESNITKILTNKINYNIDLLIEIDLEFNLISKFEKEMKILGWQII